MRFHFANDRPEADLWHVFFVITLSLVILLGPTFFVPETIVSNMDSHIEVE
jgi:hypothetical protein